MPHRNVAPTRAPGAPRAPRLGPHAASASGPCRRAFPRHPRAFPRPHAPRAASKPRARPTPCRCNRRSVPGHPARAAYGAAATVRPPPLFLLASRRGTSPIKRQSLPPRVRTSWPCASTVRHRAMCAAAAEPPLHAHPSLANRPEPLPGSPRSSPRRVLPRSGAGLAGGRHAATCAVWCHQARAPAQPQPPTPVQIRP
jgi:hypothetical protein